MNDLKLIIGSLLMLTPIAKCFSDDNDVYYAAEFTDEVKECDGFQNNIFKCNSVTVGYIKGEEGEEGSFGLTGKLELLEDIIDEYIIDLKVWKETDMTKEFMYTVSGSICGTLQKEDTPWWPLAKCFNASVCPIKQNVYQVKDLIVTLDYAKKILRHEFVGEYEVQLSILDRLENPLSCHLIYIGIMEKTKD